MKADKIFVQKSFKYFFEIFALKVNCILAKFKFSRRFECRNSFLARFSETILGYFPQCVLPTIYYDVMSGDSSRWDAVYFGFWSLQ